jgi:hypothetical protein
MMGYPRKDAARPTRNAPMSQAYEDMLMNTVYRKQDIDAIVDPGKESWIKFDRHAGYQSCDIELQDGLDGSITTYSYGHGNQRTMLNFADAPCRINTYGDSYTLCQQVTNSETWQEYLAGHLQEPVRNFGNGGQGVLHAYLHMIRAEADPETSADCFAINVFNDNHLRNLEPARWIRTRIALGPVPESDPPKHVMGVPWPHLVYDLDKHAFVLRENPLMEAEDMYDYCEKGAFYELAAENMFTRLLAMYSGLDVDEKDDLEQLAEEFAIPVDLRSPETRSDSAWRLALGYGVRSTEHVVKLAQIFADANGKKLIVLTSYSADVIIGATKNGTYMGDEFSAFLQGSGHAHHDTMPDYVADFSNSKLDLMQYMYRYFVKPAGAAVWGHLNPSGNHQYAFYVKRAIVDTLTPKPRPYREDWNPERTTLAGR